MDGIKGKLRDLPIRRSFVFYVVFFLAADILLCLLTSRFLDLWTIPARNTVMLAMVLVYSLMCLAAAAGIFYETKIKKPLRLLEQASGRIGKRDLDFSINYDSADEMGRLCHAFEQMRQALLDNQRLVWQTMQERKRLNAAFSHDMRTPLSIVSGHLEMLQLECDTIEPEEIREKAAVMEKHLKRISQYVEKINNLHKMEELPFKPKIVERRLLEEELMQIGELLCGSRGRTFTLHSQLTEKTYELDLEILMRVFENLLDNAAEHARSQVTVLLEETAASLLIRVLDDGKGFSRTALENAQRPFYTERSREQGRHMGLGLYTSRVLCGIHKGTLEIENRQVGCCVTMRIQKSQNQIKS
ncbi:HAMP domain-containing histidine kinase [Anaerovorax odorimutans]|uniref:histidine kinase n=1 Tax=Anaerovorax odorimutans TaxID=109327 RepID=A0ABT1RSP1_9FIRM|nr:HAMP domain-containing sensor histidine kinase [Anaerovorax odorimutans]MCQ4638219.1 HAMP domain-containing histidine kinase [Anaerovorax odorimutans]